MPGLQVAVLDGMMLQLDKYGSVLIRVNGRPAPRMLSRQANAGMISLYLQSPAISSLLYAGLRLTSHFGHGHVEIAFYETTENVTCYAVRNIVRSNIDRLRLNRSFSNLKILTENDEIALVEQVLLKLRSLGIVARFASPSECILLAVSPSLLLRKQKGLAIEALQRKYRRIENRLFKEPKVSNVKSEAFKEVACKSLCHSEV